MRQFLTLFALSLAFPGCGNSLNCALLGDNLRGHVTFTNAYPPFVNDRITVQASTDSFTSVTETAVIDNMQNLPTVPYKLCVPNNVNVQVRAFADRNKSGTWESGEGAGRADDDNGNNATFKNFNIPSSSSSSSDNEWEIVDSVNFHLDRTDAQ